MWVPKSTAGSRHATNPEVATAYALPLAERQRALTPAMQGRNHSMTPAEDLPAAQR